MAHTTGAHTPHRSYRASSTGAIRPGLSLVTRNCFVAAVLFWDGHVRSAISIALAYVGFGACITMKRERNGDQ